MQQWMCAAVVRRGEAAEDDVDAHLLVTVFHVTFAVPVPGELTTGFWLAPFRSR